ncbi:MAG: ribonuclease R [Gemmatimonadetes bacterium]|nr:ribonuclease R [Gemmatimonadota bacterium]MBT8403795.1 ribonuclease R [Gemmatimonadota bacterium]
MSRSFHVPEAKVLKALRASRHGPMKPKALARVLEIRPGDYKPFRAQLRDMEGRGVVYRVKGGRYAAPDRISLVRGRVSTIRSGDAFIRADEITHEDVFVRSGDLATAMDGDRVVVRVEHHPRGRNPVGRVIKVLERAHPTLVGTFHSGRKIGYIVPLDRKMGPDVLIPWGDEGDAEEGDVVVIAITSYGARRRGPTGEVKRVLGPMGDPGVDVLSVLFGHGLSLEFPPAVESAAKEAAEQPVAAGDDREDCRDLMLFTIDPVDAKDHDDALSIRDLGSGMYEVGIHIADVSHYVPRGGPVDAEALDRGTSVYLVDRTVPMLPHALSSGACSLRPDEDRYAFSLFARLGLDGEVHEHRFVRTVVRSRHKLAYETAQEVLDGPGSVDPETDAAIRDLDRVARGLRARRQERGSIDFDQPEARVVLDDDGAPIDIQRVARLDAHRLVEDFMLLANELVARTGEAKRMPVLYRVHERPSVEKTESLREFLATLGHTLPRRSLRPRDLQSVLEGVRGEPEEALVSTVVLRSMQRARYAPENLGHFGLALSHYAHFTSPIRRYPDLVTHRAMVRVLLEKKAAPQEWSEELTEVAERCSWREQAATQAERDSVALKKIEFMERHLGDEFDGTVAGVASFGFFVLLDRYFVEGLVHVNALEDDYYEFREREFALVGSRRGRRFRLGDRVRVQVARVDKEERHVDFVLLQAVPRGASG